MGGGSPFNRKIMLLGNVHFQPGNVDGWWQETTWGVMIQEVPGWKGDPEHLESWCYCLYHTISMKNSHVMFWSCSLWMHDGLSCIFGGITCKTKTDDTSHWPCVKINPHPKSALCFLKQLYMTFNSFHS